MIEIRGLKIDTTARRVWVNEEERTLTTKEFDLLTFLASHPNHVYTKEELFREIWDMESIGDIATVTVHIKKIRRRWRWIPPILSILRRYGEWGTGSRYRTEHILIIFLGEAAITLVCWNSADVDTALTDLSCRIYV